MANLTTNGPKALYPDQVFKPEDIIPEALIQTITTQTVPVEGDAPYVRVPLVAEDPDAGFVAEGAEIPADDTQLSELLLHTRKLATLQAISREAASHPDAAEMIANSMRRAVTLKADKALLTNAENPTGLLNIPGITNAGAMAAGDLDVLSDAITTIEAAGATASHIITDAATWGAIRKIKVGKDSALPLLGSPAQQTSKQLFGIPVLVNPSMPAGTILVVDKTDILSSVGAVQLAKSADAAFSSDSYLYRVTFRFGFAPIHPERIAKVSVTLGAK